MGEEIRSFASHIDSLWESFPMTMLVNQLLGGDNEQKLRDFEDAQCSVKVVDLSRRVEIPTEHYSKWKKLKLRRDQTALARKLVPRSLFVSVVSQYDAFLGKILRLIFLARPELLNASKREISFADLVQFSSIEAAREHIIGKEIDSILRMSHVEQFKWMENRFEVTLTKLDVWPIFVELTQRRNLFVHVDGFVSRQYIAECSNANCKLADGIKEGDLLAVSPAYYDEACSCIFEVGVKLANVLWRKLFPDQLRDADSSLNELSFDLIERGKLRLAIALLSFAVGLKKHSEESRRLMLVVNLAQAHKWKGNSDDCMRVLDAEDWSAVGDEFKLAEAVLRADWVRSVRIMRKIGKNGAVRKIDYRDWPLFQELRSRAEFVKTYSTIFGEAFPTTVETEGANTSNELAGEVQVEQAQIDEDAVAEKTIQRKKAKLIAGKKVNS